ncbi:hypothetical protein BGW36DRAFT_14388 [Talaromyces proteolyticus]|uniref:Uncharacterized protein n=1 Tax=Talaromyces proteolyticus TaxID=1131652 RepID=A0AAD4L416_9EURO|nr:uncharacterized protein BGW36DRAFT_14388 [Talaromyces proteolyticus]KAH8705503.1 hypothetical protein BGW36DRAFT_14388 [Talaromyces proteolyticus]
MDEFYKPQNGPIYHRYPYPPEWRNAIPNDLSDANETGHSSVLASTYQLPTTSSVRSPRFHEVHEPQAQSQSHLQPRSSPTISDVPPCSPKRQRTSDSMAITGSFPLPYKPPSDTYSYQRTPLQHNTGGVYGYEPDRLYLTLQRIHLYLLEVRAEHLLISTPAGYMGFLT